MKQRVLITGASGFVGFHLIEKALNSGLEVFVALRKSSDVKHLQAYNLQYTYPDFTDVASLDREIKQKQFNFIIHAAALTRARTPEEYNYVNATYTNNLAKAVADNTQFVKKLVFMSSLGAVGPLLSPDGLITSATVPTPVTTYGKSKLLAEKLLSDYALPSIILRPTAVFGPREKDIFIVLKTISQGMEPYIGNVQQRLSFIYVKDLATLTINALFTTGTGVYNITDGNCYGRYELANITKHILGRKTLKVHLPYGIVKGLAILLEKGYGLVNKSSVLNKERLNELTAINWCCDITKAQKELGFQPAYNLEQGLKESINWYQENKWL